MPRKSASKKARKSKDAAEKTPRKAKKAPARAGKGQRARSNGKTRKAEVKSDGNGKRMTNKDRILRAWEDSDQEWPPNLGDKIRLFVPKDLRGKMAKVIAVGDEKAKESTRVAPKDKARIMLKVGGEPVQFAVAQSDVFPKAVTLKDLQALA